MRSEWFQYASYFTAASLRRKRGFITARSTTPCSLPAPFLSHLPLAYLLHWMASNLAFLLVLRDALTQHAAGAL